MVPSGPSLGQRLLAAADALEELAEMYNHPIPDKTPFSAWELRAEIRKWVTA